MFLLVETGGGKALIIDAINIISGGRFPKDMIRISVKHTHLLNSTYILPDNELSDEGNIIVSREIQFQW